MPAKLIQVIEVRYMKGTGAPDDKERQVVEYWTTDGETLLAQVDPLAAGEPAKAD